MRKLKTENFSGGEDLVDFVNENDIRQKDIQTITINPEDGYFYIFYWED